MTYSVSIYIVIIGRCYEGSISLKEANILLSVIWQTEGGGLPITRVGGMLCITFKQLAFFITRAVHWMKLSLLMYKSIDRL